MSADVPPVCQVCGAQTGDDLYLCQTCTDTLAETLAELPALLRDLDVTRQRLDVIPLAASQSRRRQVVDDVKHTADDRPDLGSHGPLPIHVGASAVSTAADALLTRWATNIGTPYTTARDTCRRLHAHLWALRSRPDVGDLTRDLQTLAGRIRRTIDRPADRVYAGPCHAVYDDGTRCTLDLYAPPGAETIICDGWNTFAGVGCGAEHTAQHRHTFLLDALEGLLLPVDELLPTVAKLLGKTPPPRGVVWAWRKRGDLPTLGEDRHGRDLVRASDLAACVRRYTPTPQRDNRARL